MANGRLAVISLKPVIKLLTNKPEGFSGLWFRQVAGAAEYARIKPDALPLPAAWVVRAGDRVTHAGERTEDVKLAFDVVIAIENVRSHAAGDTDDLLLVYRKAVKDLLLGWEIEAGVTTLTPLKFEGGQVLEYTDGDLYWRDRYVFDALITNYLPDPPAYGGLDNTGENP
jgi:hypothetical protein